MKFKTGIHGLRGKASFEVLSLCLCVLCFSVRTMSAEDQRLWTPASDEIYLQEINHKIETPAAVESIAKSTNR
jgi:hypothetical protein